MIEGSGVELDKLHVPYGAFGAVDHGDAVARGHQRIGGVAVYSFATARSHDGYFGEERIHLSGIFVQHIGAIAFDARSIAGDDNAQVVLRNDFHRKEIGKYGDVGVLLHGFNQAFLYLRTRIVLVVQDAEFRVSAFFVQVEFSVIFFVEIHSPFNEFTDLSGSIAHYLFYGCTVAYPVSGNHGVFDMLVEIVYRQVGDGGYPALCEISVCLFQAGLADEGYCSFMRHFQRKTHTGNSGADNEEIELSYHSFVYLTPQNYKISTFLVSLMGINS